MKEEGFLQIIISHTNTDFDALASMIAAKKLYPDAKVVISTKQNIQVKQFLTIYRDILDFTPDNQVDWSEVTEIILVDVASLSRIGSGSGQLNKDNLSIKVYDHHPPSAKNVKTDDARIEPVGAAVTLLIEEIIKQDLPISSFEATLFGLGIYTDTGSFTYSTTTFRDFEAARFLMEQGMNLEMIQRFSDHILLPEQQELLSALFLEAKTYHKDGLEIIVSSYETDKFQAGLNVITEKLLDITASDAALTIVKMKQHVYLVGRARAKRITLLPLVKKFGGGGHDQAGSATIKKGDLTSLSQQVTEQLDLILKPATTARDMMSSPVKMLQPETTIEEAGRLMYRYGHSGYPVVQDDKLQGIITRRDLDKANHHGLGHAPVKAYMTTNLITARPETTIEEIQQLIIEHNIGRLPVVENGKAIGIITRTNLIELLHHPESTEEAPSMKDNLEQEMKSQLPEEIYSLLKDVSKTANETAFPVYLIGGMVRDIFLNQPNDDIDIVVEGDGITFAKQLQANFGGEVVVHENFGTATWEHPSNHQIDVTSARLEYYDRPASLPDVETSTLREDLYRRDFTINAMAIRLNSEAFGQVVDPFRGQMHLQEKKVSVLHNLSFIEDPTRILRAVRFETRFSFAMDEQTETLAIHSIERMKNLSANRIIDEMKRIFTEVNPMQAIKRLFELHFWQQFGVSSESLEESYAHTEQVGKTYALQQNKKPSWFTYFIIPFFTEGNIQEAKQFALTKEDIKFLQEVEVLTNNREWQTMERVGDFQRFLKNHSDEAILFIIATGNFPNKDVILSYLKKRQQLSPLLTGKDLIDKGMKPGASFSKILLELEIAILNGEVNTKEEAFVWLQKQLLTD